MFPDKHITSQHHSLIAWPTRLLKAVSLLIIAALANIDVAYGQKQETWPSGFAELAKEVERQNIVPYEDGLRAFRASVDTLEGEEKLEALAYLLYLDRGRGIPNIEVEFDLFKASATANKSSRYALYLEIWDMIPDDVSDEQGFLDAANSIEHILETRDLDPGQRIYATVELTTVNLNIDREFLNLDLIENLGPFVDNADDQYAFEKIAFYEAQHLTYNGLQQAEDSLRATRKFFDTVIPSNFPISSDSVLYNLTWVSMIQGYLDEAAAVNNVNRSIAERSKFPASRFIPEFMCARIANQQEKFEEGLPCLEEAAKHLDDWLILASTFKIEAAKAYANAGQPARASDYLNSITDEELNFVSPTIRRTIQEVEALIQYAEGDYKTAFETYRAYNKEILTRFDDLNNRTTREIRALSKKEMQAMQELNVALENRTQIQQENYERVQFYLAIVIGGAIFAAVLASLLGYQIFSKQKLFAQLETANGALKESLHERELLLQEIHHRIKNNLQLITSLLNLQGRRIKNEGPDGEAKRVIREINGRVHTMSLIHKELYRSQDYDSLDVARLIQDLTAYVVSLFGESTELDIDLDSFVLNLNQAMPIGLITCEVLTNCLEHGRSDDANPKISIRLKEVANNINLKISDNGPGFQTEPNFKKTKSLGLLLIRDLTQQIGGDFSLYNCPEAGGVCFDFTVPINPK